jgi:hypothetical protein
MTIAKLALSSALTALAVGAAIAAAPCAVAANVDQGPVVAGPTEPGPAIEPAPPQGGPVAIFPWDQLIGGANPDLPDGTDPLVPYGVWTP